MAYLVYEYGENDTFASIAEAYNMTVKNLLTINNISPPYPTYPSQTPHLHGYVRIAETISGNQSTDTVDTELPVFAYGKIDDTSSVSQIGQTLSGVYDSQATFAYHQCYIEIDGNTYYFPCFPASYSDSSSSSISQLNPLGRSEPFQIYSNSGPRKVDVSFEMHREMFVYRTMGGSGARYDASNTNAEFDEMDILINALQSAVYPKTEGSGDYTIVPKVRLVLGNNCRITGIIDGSVSVSWNGPINPNKKYSMASVSFGVVEVTGNPKTHEWVLANGVNNIMGR